MLVESDAAATTSVRVSSMVYLGGEQSRLEKGGPFRVAVLECKSDLQPFISNVHSHFAMISNSSIFNTPSNYLLLNCEPIARSYFCPRRTGIFFKSRKNLALWSARLVYLRKLIRAFIVRPRRF
jgi:hypothetical protein